MQIFEMESTDSKGAVEQIKVEPDLFFATGDMCSQNSENDASVDTEGMEHELENAPPQMAESETTQEEEMLTVMEETSAQKETSIAVTPERIAKCEREVVCCNPSNRENHKAVITGIRKVTSYNLQVLNSRGIRWVTLNMHLCSSCRLALSKHASKPPHTPKPATVASKSPPMLRPSKRLRTRDDSAITMPASIFLPPGSGQYGMYTEKPKEEQPEGIHTGEKPYVCRLCPQRFTQSCNLYSHYRRNHGVDPRTNPQLFNKLRHQLLKQGVLGMAVSKNRMSWPQAARPLPRLIPKPTSQPFKCCVCEEPFFDRDLLYIHEETHVPEAPFECRHCNTMFSVLSNFRTHISVHRISMKANDNSPKLSGPGMRSPMYGPVATRKVQQAAPKPDTQPNSSSSVLNSNRPFIPSNDPEYPYKCAECKRNFQKHELYYHMKVHLKQKNIFTKKDFKCDKCGKVFEKDLTLRKHMETAHPVVSSASSDGSFLVEALKTDARSLSPMATKAGKVQLTSEVDVVPVETTIKEEPGSSVGDDEVNSTVSDNPILTHLLNTTSEQSTGSNSASRTGTPVNPGDADLSIEGGFVISAVATVDPSFLQQLDEMERSQQQPPVQEEPQTQQMPLLRRMPVLEERLRQKPFAQSNAKPLKSGPYKCLHCNKLFNEHFGFRQHMRAMHYSEKRYKCRECGKKFTLGITLAMHLRIHTSVHPFTCIVCYKTFTRSTSLNGHLSSHSYSRIKCAECGEAQLNVFNYMKHIDKFHPNFLYNVKSYRTKAEAMQKRRRELVLEITRGLAKHRSEIPNVLARLKGQLSEDNPILAQSLSSTPPPKATDDQQEVSSTEQIHVKKEQADSAQSEVVSSASEEREAQLSDQEALPALRAELRKRPLSNSASPNRLEDLALSPERKSPRSSMGSSSPNLKRLLEQGSPNSCNDASVADISSGVAVKSEPSL